MIVLAHFYDISTPASKIRISSKLKIEFINTMSFQKKFSFCVYSALFDLAFEKLIPVGCCHNKRPDISLWAKNSDWVFD